MGPPGWVPRDGSWDLLFPISMSPTANYESRKLFLMTSLQYYCILGLAEMKTLHPKTKLTKLCAKDSGCAGNKITGVRAKKKSYF